MKVKKKETDDQQGLPEMEDSQGGSVDNENLPDMEDGGEVGEDTSSSAPDMESGDDEDVKALRDVMVQKGFNDVRQLLDWAKKLEKSNTELSQRAQRLGSIPGFSPQFPNIPMPGQAPQVPQVGGDKRWLKLPDNPVEILQDKETFARFLSQFEESVQEKLIREYEQREWNKKYAEMGRRINEIKNREPDEFEKLRPIMLEITNANPYIDDVDYVYNQAKKVYEDRKRSQVSELKRELGLNDVPLDRLKAVISRVRPAPISSGDGGNPSITTQRAEENKEFFQKILNAKRLEE